MDVTCAQLSIAGPVRPSNEDCVGFWEPEDPEERRSLGAIALLADGVGGQGSGEVASQLAIDTALQQFQGINRASSPTQVIRTLFNAANTAVYDAGMEKREPSRMGTTLTIALFRNNQITVGHVGDCRAYLIQGGQIKRLTTDHSYVALQLKLGLITEQEAAASDMKNLLTRSIGRDITVQVDSCNVQVNSQDCFVQCCDGVHGAVFDGEILTIAGRLPPEEACRELIALAARRGADDNLSVQVVRIDRVEQMIYYRGAPIYQDVPSLAMSDEIQVGQVVDDRFHVTDLISRSGMASIFKANDLQTGRTVALKVPFMQYESDPGFFARFQREEEIGKMLDHPYILHIIPMEEKSKPYIAMEYLEGQTLRELMRSVQQVPQSDALKIASRICEGLDYMHRHQVVHRDLKPENVMLCTDGSLRIMDFGIAKAAGMRRLTFTGFTNALGTPDYMAPEQVKGKRGDERTDIYSLGAMLYEMVTGSPPFEGTNPYAIMNARLSGDPVAVRKLNPAVSPQVEEIILHALERNPANRYATAAAMKAELDAPETVQLTGRHERLQPPALWQSRWPAVRLVLLGVLIPVVLFALLFLYSWAQR